MNKKEQTDALRKVIPEAILPTATDFDIQIFDRDNDCDLFSYRVAVGTQAETIEKLKAQFEPAWKVDPETSDTLSCSMVRHVSSPHSIDKRVKVFVSQSNQVLVLQAGIDSAWKRKRYDEGPLPLFEQTVQKWKSKE